MMGRLPDFGPAPNLDERLVSKNGDRAKFLRNLLEDEGELTIRQMANAWVVRQGVFDRKEANKLRKSVELWVRQRVKAGEFVQIGESGDEYGSMLYGYRHGRSL